MWMAGKSNNQHRDPRGREKKQRFEISNPEAETPLEEIHDKLYQ
jgi:hypothetical protein